MATAFIGWAKRVRSRFYRSRQLKKSYTKNKGDSMDIDAVVLYAMVAAYVGEKGLALYKRVMADGKITLDEIEEIIEEVTDLADDAKEMVKKE